MSLSSINQLNCESLRSVKGAVSLRFTLFRPPSSCTKILVVAESCISIDYLSMKTLLTLLLCVTASLHAFADAVSSLKTLQNADDARVAAMRSPDSQTLSALLSEDLRYAHSNGVVDTRASLMEVLMTGKTKYLGFEYQQRNFTFPAPGIALMSGRAQVKAATAAGEMDSTLSFLAVWREEAGQWRFLAWQSCKVP
jgi:hypothetical protein